LLFVSSTYSAGGRIVIYVTEVRSAGRTRFTSAFCNNCRSLTLALAAMICGVRVRLAARRTRGLLLKSHFHGEKVGVTKKKQKPKKKGKFRTEPAMSENLNWSPFNVSLLWAL